jgi:hypothetical protein
MKSSKRSLAEIALSVSSLLLASVPLGAQTVLIAGGGNYISGGGFYLGTHSGSPSGLVLTYDDVAADVVKLHSNRVGSWLWENYDGASTLPSMRLDQSNNLILYNGLAEGIKLNPVFKSITLGASGAVLTNTSGTDLSTNGSFAAGGTLSATGGLSAPSAVFSSGLNGTPIGNVTPSTGVFTTVTATSQGSRFGSNVGNWTSPTNTNTNLLLYNTSATNWAGIGADSSGGMYFVTGVTTPTAKLRLDTSGNATLSGSLTTSTIATASGGLTLAPAGGTISIPSTSSTMPQMEMSNTANHVSGPSFRFKKSRTSAAVAVGDGLGGITWTGRGAAGVWYDGASLGVGVLAVNTYVQTQLKFSTMDNVGVSATRLSLDNAAAMISPPLTLSAGTASSSTTTGALILSGAGGLGVGGNAFIGGNATVTGSITGGTGIFADAPTTYPAGIRRIVNVTSTAAGDAGGTTDVRGIDSTITAGGTANIAAVQGVYANVKVNGTAGTVANAVGSLALAEQTGAASVNFLSGAWGKVNTTGSGTVTNAYGVQAFLTQSGTGNVTNWTGFLMTAVTASSTGDVTGAINGFRANGWGRATATTAYGFNAEDATKGSGILAGFRGGVTAASGKYNLYLDGTAQNYLAGNVGIGTATPAVKLDVVGDASVSGNLAVAGTFSSVSLGSTSLTGGATGLNLAAGGTNQNITVTPSGTGSTVLNGNVGIGTASPTAKLDVAGSGKLSGSLDVAGTLNSSTISGGASGLTLNAGGTNQNITLNPSGTGGVIVNTDNVTIAGTAPTTVYKDSDGKTAYWHVNSNTMYLLSGPQGSGIGQWQQVNSRWPLTVDLTNNYATFGGSGYFPGQGVFGPSAPPTDAIVNAGTNNGAYTTAFHGSVVSNGGIGAILDVSNASNWPNDILVLRRQTNGGVSPAVGSAANIAFTLDAGTAAVHSPQVSGRISSILTAINGSNNSTAMTFSTASAGSLSEKMRITDAGNVGIGVAAPSQTLDVEGSIRAGGRARVELIRTITGATGDTVAVGSLTNDGVGKNIRVYLKGHNGSVIDAHTYEINEVAYIGPVTNWLEVPLNQNSVSYTGTPAYALDVFRPNINSTTDALYVRIRVKRPIGGGTVQLVVEYDDDSIFTPLTAAGSSATAFNASTSPAGGVVDGYYGAAEWMFPVSNGNGWANAGSYGLFIKNTGNVGIGTTAPTHKLSVNGTIRAKEIIVDNTNWADYVFEEDYRLAPLAEVESHIKAKGHLPGIPSAAEVAEKGVNMGDMQAKLLSKVEELTLHLIRMEKENAALRERVVALEGTAGRP